MGDKYKTLVEKEPSAVGGMKSMLMRKRRGEGGEEEEEESLSTRFTCK